MFLVGDYADLSESNVPYFRALRKWTDKLHQVGGLYEHARETFTQVNGDPENRGFRFIYNYDRKQYIDLLHCPECFDGTDWREGHIAPLPLLIAMGNGRGGGDYYSCENDKFVGSCVLHRPDADQSVYESQNRRIPHQLRYSSSGSL